MSEFNSPCVGAAGLRVSRWLLGFGRARWGPSAALLQREQKAPRAWGGSSPFLAVVSGEQSPKGTVVLQNLPTILAAARGSLNRICP